MSERILSVCMLIPGPWSDAAAVVDILERHGIRSAVRGDGQPAPGEIAVEIVADESLADGFSWGRQGQLPDDVLNAIADCSEAALIEVAARLDSEANVFAKLGRALWEAGGLAVRMEGSGASSEWRPWLERVESGTPEGIYEMAVLTVRDGRDTYFTCGMHQFDLPDAQIVLDDPEAATDWLDRLNVFQLAESPVLGSGHTFSPTAETEARTLERWPDHRHHSNDGRFNPFGVWRLLPETEARVEAGNLVPVIIPSLVVVLAAMERRTDLPLTASEVSEIVGKSPCIAMKLADAIALERSRGYADVEPDLAWEQWQLVRKTQ